MRFGIPGGAGIRSRVRWVNGVLEEESSSATDSYGATLLHPEAYYSGASGTILDSTQSSLVFTILPDAVIATPAPGGAPLLPAALGALGLLRRRRPAA